MKKMLYGLAIAAVAAMATAGAQAQIQAWQDTVNAYMARVNEVHDKNKAQAEAQVAQLQADAKKAVAIARTLSQTSLFNEVVREQVVAFFFGAAFLLAVSSSARVRVILT